jgi:hypothetical protein
MDLDRQERPDRVDAAGRRLVPSRVLEEHPPLLGDWFIYFSVVVLICGVLAITALEFGTPVTSGFVRVPALIGAGLLVVLSADAALRVWRSAWAWLPVDRGRGMFRFVWAAVLVGILLLAAGAIVYLVTV